MRRLCADHPASVSSNQVDIATTMSAACSTLAVECRHDLNEVGFVYLRWARGTVAFVGFQDLGYHALESEDDVDVQC